MIRNFNAALTDDPIFQDRSVEARLLFFSLWNHTKNHCCGLIQIGTSSLIADVRMPTKAVQDALAELAESGLIHVQAERNLIWLPGMRDLLGKVGSKLQIQIQKYLAGIRPCVLVKRVSEACGIPYPDLDFNSGIGYSDLDSDQNKTRNRVLIPKTKDLDPKASDLKPEGIPLPAFQPMELWEALAAKAGAKLRLDRKSADNDAGVPYTQFSNFTHAALGLAKREPPYALTHYELAGDWIAAGGLEWHAKHNKPPWKRVCDALEECLSSAEEWDRDGRKAINGERAPPPWKPDPTVGRRADDPDKVAEELERWKQG